MEFPPGSETEEAALPTRAETKDTLLLKYDIPISHLDFAYVEKCTDSRELERIVHILQSGEEGYYPQLIATTEERLRIVKPNSRYIRQVTPVVDKSTLDTDTRRALCEDLGNFLKNASQHDSEVGKVNAKKVLDIPDVRKANANNQADPAKQIEKPNRIKATDYASWDKYDPDTEILKMDLQTEQLQKQHQEKQDEEAIITPLKKEVKFEEIYTETEAALESNQERLKGNEFYKSGDYKEALACYTNSINIHPSIEGYNNRAQANIMLKNFQQAMTDSQTALKYDTNNIKANMRLAQSLNELHFYRDAVKHLERVIYLDPNNRNAQNLLNTVRSKQNKQQTSNFSSNDSKWPKGGKTRMKITEISSSSPSRSSPSRSPNQRRNKRKSILKKASPLSKSHVLVPIPGPSHMQEPYYVVIDDKDPEMIKKAQYMLYNKPQVMFVSHPLDSDDEEYFESQSDNAHDDYEYNTYSNRAQSTTTLKDIKRRIKNFSKNKAQNMEQCCAKENNQNNINITMADVVEDKVEEETLKITEIRDSFTETSESLNDGKLNEQNDSAIEDSSLAETDSADQLKSEVSEDSLVAPPASETANNSDYLGDDINNNEVYINNYANPTNPTTTAVNGGGGEPHLRNAAENPRLEDIETPFSFLRAWTAVHRDETYTQQANLLRNLNATRLEEVIGYKLDGTMLTDLLRTLYMHFTVPHEVERLHAFLVHIAALPRFSVMTLFINAADRIKTRNLFEFLDQHGMPIDEQIKNAYL